MAMDWHDNVAVGVGGLLRNGKEAPYSLYEVGPNGELYICGDGWKADRKDKRGNPIRRAAQLGSVEKAKEIAEGINDLLIEEIAKHKAKDYASGSSEPL
jgi:hypothetical protein